MKPKGISVIIPCLDEAETIAIAVKEAFTGLHACHLPAEVIVVDNGSSDRSKELAAEAGARVIEAKPKGYGIALNAGILSARYEIVVFADADLSYCFEEIPALVRPLLEEGVEFVLGSRILGSIEPGAMPFLNRYFGTPVLSLLIRRIFGLPISDCNSRMRAFLSGRYPELSLRARGMEYASEMLVRIAQQRWKYMEVPIHFKKDQRRRPSHLRRWKDGWRHLRFILGFAPR